jgi:hypothetical protein
VGDRPLQLIGLIFLIVSPWAAAPVLSAIVVSEALAAPADRSDRPV